MEQTAANYDERMMLTRGVIGLLRSWGAREEQMQLLLDMPATMKPRHFARFGNSEPLPDAPQVMKRIDYLVRIADALRTTHPTSSTMAQRWMRQRNRRFGGRTPLGLMLEGEEGIVSVLAHLDCTFAWDLTGSSA